MALSPSPPSAALGLHQEVTAHVRQQLPLKLAWAVTIHKAQGMTLDKVVIDVGKKEFSCGLTFVACSRVRQLSGLLFDPSFPFQRVASLTKSQQLQERLLEDARPLLIESNTLSQSRPPDTFPTPSPPAMVSPTPSPPAMVSPTPSPPTMVSPHPQSSGHGVPHPQSSGHWPSVIRSLKSPCSQVSS